MNPRALFSGPSRVRAITSGFSYPAFAPVLPARRLLLTFPHPDLDPSKGSTKLVIKTFNNIPSLLHAYAIVRAVSSKLGASVLEVRIPKDPDSLKHGPTIFLTTLRPVKLESPLLLEIPPPNISNESNFLGGPSLNDVESILSATPASASTDITESPSGKDQPLQFRVDVQRNSVKPDTRPTRRRKYRGPGKEGAQIVAELQKFGGGFYGGFDGLAEKFEKLLPGKSTEQESRAETQESSQSSDNANSSALEPITITSESAARPIGDTPSS